MTASQQQMTDGQIENLVDKFRATLRKHRSEISQIIAQEIVGIENLGMECYEPIRKHVEVRSNTIVRRVKVNRNRNGQEAIDATGRRQYAEKSVVNAMPQGEGEEVEVIFFNIGRYVTDDELDKEYELRGLEPVDPYSLSAVNEADPAFADKKPNATHWKDSNNKSCYAAFNQWRGDGRNVNVLRHGDGWLGSWWFGGVRKYPKHSLES